MRNVIIRSYSTEWSLLQSLCSERFKSSHFPREMGFSHRELGQMDRVPEGERGGGGGAGKFRDVKGLNFLTNDKEDKVRTMRVRPRPHTITMTGELRR